MKGFAALTDRSAATKEAAQIANTLAKTPWHHTIVFDRSADTDPISSFHRVDLEPDYFLTPKTLLKTQFNLNRRTHSLCRVRSRLLCVCSHGWRGSCLFQDTPACCACCLLSIQRWLQLRRRRWKTLNNTVSEWHAIAMRFTDPKKLSSIKPMRAAGSNELSVRKGPTPQEHGVWASCATSTL